MTVGDIIADYYDETTDNEKCNACTDMLYQEALRISMELNSQYHTSDEISKIMGRLTGWQIDDSFRHEHWRVVYCGGRSSHDKRCTALYCGRRCTCKND